MLSVDDADFIERILIDRRIDYYRIACAFCGEGDDSLDAISEMTVIVFEKFHSLRDRDAFSSWSTKILVNVCRKYLRQRKRISYIEDLETEPATPSDVDRLDLSKDLENLLASIKPIYREVVVMKELLEYTYGEIAAELRIPVGTAKSRCDYGLKLLRRKLGGYDDE
jgi:RNA polymerase sigma-70 factor (ECF subfamily)